MLFCITQGRSTRSGLAHSQAGHLAGKQRGVGTTCPPYHDGPLLQNVEGASGPNFKRHPAGASQPGTGFVWAAACLTYGVTLRSRTKRRAYEDRRYGGGGRFGGGSRPAFDGGKGYGRGGSNFGGPSPDQLAAEKRERETRAFLRYQQEVLANQNSMRGGKGRGRGRSEMYWKQEEKTLFKTAHVSAGIEFDKYDHIPVDRKGGKGTEVVIDTFQDLLEDYQLPDDLSANIKRCDYNIPTPVQKHAIPASLLGSDVMVSAQTGSGKTAAFLIPVIAVALQKGPRQLCEGPVAPRCVVLAPTRELCQQISMEAERLCFRSACRIVSIYGGAAAMPQLKQLAEGCDLAICTPGRLEDFLNRGVMKMDEVQFLILDEADRMLDMGFEPQIRSIVERHGMPSAGDGENTRQTMMFSATFPREMQDLAMDFMARNYLWIGVGRVGAASESVKQRFTDVRVCTEDDKFQALLGALNEIKGSDGGNAKTIIFANQKTVVDDLGWQLSDARIRNAQIHGGLSQNQRDRALHALKSGRADVLVATDVAARGLDLPGVDHVINYELPTNVDSYVHRIGRTGRIGNTGVATSFVTSEEPALREIVENLKGNEGADAVSQVPSWLEEMTMRRLGGSGRQRQWRSPSGYGGRQRSDYGRASSSGPPRRGSRDMSRDDSYGRGRSNDRGGSYGRGRSYDRDGSFGQGRSYDRDGSYGRGRSNDRGGSFGHGRSYGRSPGGSYGQGRSYDRDDNE